MAGASTFGSLDRDLQAKHTSAAVCEMFRGFSGYIQADAHAIYDALFRGDAVDEESEAPTEVACWSHALGDTSSCANLRA